MHYMHGSSGSSLACYLLVTLDVFALPSSVGGITLQGGGLLAIC